MARDCGRVCFGGVCHCRPIGTLEDKVFDTAGVYHVFEAAGFLIVKEETVYAWVYRLCPFDTSSTCLGPHDKEIDKGVHETVRVLSYH